MWSEVPSPIRNLDTVSLRNRGLSASSHSLLCKKLGPIAGKSHLLCYTFFQYKKKHFLPFQLAISIPSVALVSYYWFVPESPRWLVAKGRFKEALKILKNGADTNSNTLPPDEEVFAVMQKIFEQVL